MSITVNIDGVDKIVDTPSVNIGGIWRTVSTVCNNIDGIWKQSYPDAYAINLYVYGELYDTLYCTKGSKITLPSVSTVYEDETAHYGWTTTSGSTSRNYAATASITPTSDMNLYAVFSYSVTSEGTKSALSSNTEQSITITLSGTMTVTNTSYSYNYSSGSSARSLTRHTDNYLKINGTSKNLPTGYNDYGTITGNISYTYTVSVGDVITYKARGPFYTSYHSITGTLMSSTTDSFSISYPAYITATKYRSTI